MSELKQKLTNYAYALLARREYSVFELEQKLSSWLKRNSDTDSQNLVPEILRELIDQNHLSDERFTQSFIEHKSVINGWGKQKIWQKLRAKGIEESVFVSLWEDFDPNIIADKVKQDCQNKIRTWHKNGFSEAEIKNRLLRFLAGRGFGYRESLEIFEQVGSDQ